MFACLGVPRSRMFISICVGIDVVDRREDRLEPSLDPCTRVAITIIAYRLCNLVLRPHEDRRCGSQIGSPPPPSRE